MDLIGKAAELWVYIKLFETVFGVVLLLIAAPFMWKYFKKRNAKLTECIRRLKREK